MHKLITAAGKLMGLSGEQWAPERVVVQTVNPDGSQRLFYRLIGPGDRRILVIQPPENDEAGRQEARAAWNIGSHLYDCGVPVPKVYGFEEESGSLFVEDLGEQRLHDLLQDAPDAERLAWYQQVTAELVRMQIQGVQRFSPTWCWDTPRYDQKLMLERESGYFLQALCREYLNLSFDFDRVESECRLLARRASSAPADFFLHRDFQSRNIMIKEGKVRIIDFQGGRLGPLAYDLASLLIDPYMGLSDSLQQDIRRTYFSQLNALITYDHSRFEQEYHVLALQRNMQILGAFAFLSQQRKKPFFFCFIEPALRSLNSLLANPESADYAALREITSQSLAAIKHLSRE